MKAQSRDLGQHIMVFAEHHPVLVGILVVSLGTGLYGLGVLHGLLNDRWM